MEEIKVVVDPGKDTPKTSPKDPPASPKDATKTSPKDTTKDPPASPKDTPKDPPASPKDTSKDPPTSPKGVTKKSKINTLKKVAKLMEQREQLSADTLADIQDKLDVKKSTPEKRKQALQICGGDFKFESDILSNILQCLPTKERRAAFDLLWPGVTDKEKITEDFIEDNIIRTDHNENCVNGITTANLCFRLITFILSLVATTVIAINSGFTDPDSKLTLTWVTFGLSTVATVFKALDSGALPLVAAYYASQIRQDENSDVSNS